MNKSCPIESYQAFYDNPALTGRTVPACLAVSAKWYEFPEKFEWLAEAGFAFEYTPDVDNFELLPEHIDAFLARGIAIRHHAFFPGYEIGNINVDEAELAMDMHFKMFDIIEGRGEQVVTVHIGLVPKIDIEPGRAAENLGRLVQYGRNRGITVSLENLKQGPTSHPETLLNWVEQTGASITMDIGHTVSCVQKNDGFEVSRIVDMFSPYLIEIHYYEKETDHHHAPRDMSVLGPIVDRLLTTECQWWTIELEPYSEIIRTQQMLFDYLDAGRTGGEPSNGSTLRL